MSNQLKGAACGVVAAVAYGTNPLFSLNLYARGMDVESVLLYRFAIAALVLGAALLLSGRSLAVSRRQLAALVPAGVVFAMSSQTLYQSFLYMDAGVACSILFIYPILVAVIMTLFFHEKASLLTYGCIAVATAGIAMLYKGDGSGALSTVGLLLVAASSLCYAVYIVGVDHSALRTVPSARMTFWVLASGAVVFFALTRPARLPDRHRRRLGGQCAGSRPRAYRHPDPVHQHRDKERRPYLQCHNRRAGAGHRAGHRGGCVRRAGHGAHIARCLDDSCCGHAGCGQAAVEARCAAWPPLTMAARTATGSATGAGIALMNYLPG